MTVPPRKVEHPKGKAKETSKQKAKEAKKTTADLTVEQIIRTIEGMMKKQEAQLLSNCRLQSEHLLVQIRNRECDQRIIFEREEKKRIIDTFLDTGYVFRPSDGILLDYHLRNRILGKRMDYCPIKEVNVYQDHPRALIGKSRVQYFFTHNRPNHIQPGIDIPGQWILGERKDVFHHKERVGVKQVVEYCEAGQKSEYKIAEYQLDPLPENKKDGPMYVCKLYNDALGEL